ncbi:MAG: homoserine dehydrogenase, partial [Actinobacteria bacterium]|nr:homoserine dehydrogenase [Actinomycetota bacterium]
MAYAIGIGLLGLGTVGSAVARTLRLRAAYLERRLGRTLAIRRALVRDLTRLRDVPFGLEVLTTDPADAIEARDVDVVVEVMGGVEPAHQYLRRALDAGKHVVTANKEVIATHGVALMRHAAERNLDVYFEASVGGGLPLIGPFRQDLAANDVREMHAILNGTTNYILTQMAAGQGDYATALAEAQRLGYAEPDPTNDVEGHDSAYKLAILGMLAFESEIRPDQVYREGITKLASADFKYAAELGYAIKLLAIAKQRPEGIELRVHPALVGRDSVVGQVDGVYNVVRINGDLVGNALFIGRGAGPEPTSSAIVADLIDLGHNLRAGAHARVPVLIETQATALPMSAVRSRFYLRLWVTDRPGVLAKITAVCGEEQISIASIIQKEADVRAGQAEIVLLTHSAVE